MDDLKSLINEYEVFLSSLKLEPNFFKVKTVEMDLKGSLNPVNLLYDFFIVNKKWISFQNFFNFYIVSYHSK